MKIKDYEEQYGAFVMPTYKRTPLVLVRGRGVRVWDIHQTEYLDFFPGWAVSGIGHCHPKVVSAVKEQVKKIIHVPNNYYNALQGRLAEKIIKASFPGKAFFCNSGAEANEGAIKLARVYGKGERFEIICMENSFHGRTLAALTATGQQKYREAFGPLPVGFKYVPFNDIDAIKSAIGDKTVAVLMELIQGEGGINVANQEYIEELREITKKRDILLIFDEVQTGMGRTGKMFCFEHYGVQPDVMTLAKTLGGGIPIGAMVAASRVTDILKPGMHASTFGGSPVACAASLAVFKAIEKEGLLKNAQEMGKYLFSKLNVLKEKHSVIKEVRGKALMLGVELTKDGKLVVEKCLEKKLLINCTHETVLRLMPPLTVTKRNIDTALSILEEAL